VALLGPNRAGKSTTFDVLLGLTRPDAGRVTLFGGPPRAAVKVVSAHTAGAKAAVPGHKQSSRSSDLRMNWTTVDSDALNPAFA
jgi:ABC-type branched-subunit amino acid transport system ATPase component